jgi:hypothetical protein
MKMAAKRNVSIVSLLESRRINGTPFGLTAEKKRVFTIACIQSSDNAGKKRVIAVIRRKETLAFQWF